MAGDWIKVEKSTPLKPEIKAAAKACGITKEQAFSAWFALWCLFDDHVGEDSIYHNSTLAECSEHVGIAGFAESLSENGWIFDIESGVFISNWERHNGQSSKIRALDLRRKKRKK